MGLLTGKSKHQNNIEANPELHLFAFSDLQSLTSVFFFSSMTSYPLLIVMFRAITYRVKYLVSFLSFLTCMSLDDQQNIFEVVKAYN